MKKIDSGKLEMLMMYYRDGMTFEGIGEVYGLSRTKISRDVRGILEELKEVMRG
jgi:DNA-directed RNA polymerase specialized sigma subunit